MGESVVKGYHIIFVLCMLVLIPGTVLGAVPGDILKNLAFGLPDGPEWGYGLDTSADGNVTVCGVAYPDDSIDLGHLGNGDVWVIRFDKNSTVLWEKLIGGNETDYALSIRNLPDGGAALIGTTGSFNGDVSDYHGNGDMWVVNLGPDGNIRWERALGETNTDEGSDLVVLPDGHIIVCGYSMSSRTGDLWMLRLDSKGNIIWQRAYGSDGRDSGTSIITTSDGSLVACGNTNSTDNATSPGTTSSDIWVLKTDLNGTPLWDYSYGGSSLDWGHSVIELTSGDLMVAAVTASSDGDVSNNHGAGDIWLLRLDPEGNLIWEKSFGGSFSDNVWKLEPAAGGGAYFVGDSYSVDGDFSGNHGEADLVIGEVDENGTLLWHRLIGGSSVDRGSWVGKTDTGTLMITGMTASSDGDLSGNHTSGDLWVLEVQGNEDKTPFNVLSIGPLGGDGPVPTDPDGDGKYEDLNGNGKMDLQDPTVFFQYFDWISKQDFQSAFDFNENGGLDLSDVQALFAEIQP